MASVKGRKARLTPVDKELIYQTYLVTQNKSETARRTRVSVASVKNVLRDLTKNNEVDTPTSKEARADVAARLQGRIHVRANELLDSITPLDLESGRIAVYGRDAEGKEVLTGYRYYGPSLVQKATAFGIITDKANVAQQYELALRRDAQSGQLMLPEDIQGLVAACTGKIQSLSALNVQFRQDNPDLSTKLDSVLREVTQDPSSAPIRSIDEFDNPA